MSYQNIYYAVKCQIYMSVRSFAPTPLGFKFDSSSSSTSSLPPLCSTLQLFYDDSSGKNLQTLNYVFFFGRKITFQVLGCQRDTSKNAFATFQQQKLSVQFSSVVMATFSLYLYNVVVDIYKLLL